MENSKIAFKDNAFDLLRILAAFQVMFGHMVEHLELGSAANGLVEILVRISHIIPGRGVIIFFAISGYLAIPSIENCSLWQYCKKKFARIYPGLWFAFLINTIIIATLYGMPQRLLDNLIYIVTQTTFFQFYTGDWLRGYGASTANGSLWTISVLIQFYIVAYVFYKKCYHWRLGGWIASIIGMQAVSVLISNCGSFMPEILYKLINVSLIPYFYIFMLGMFVYKFRERMLPVIKEKVWLLFACYIIIKVLLMNINMPISLGVNYDIFTASLLSFAVIGIAYRLGTIRFKNEISYGIFIWHMIVVNIAIEIIKINGWGQNISMRCMLGLIGLLVTILASYISTVFVERPFRKIILNKGK